MLTLSAILGMILIALSAFVLSVQITTYGKSIADILPNVKTVRNGEVNLKQSAVIIPTALVYFWIPTEEFP